MPTVLTNHLMVDGARPTMLYQGGHVLKKIVTVWEAEDQTAVLVLVETTSANETVALTTTASAYTGLTVDWGDGTTPAAGYSHQYASAGSHTIKIYCTDGTDITTVRNEMFLNCGQIKSISFPDSVTTGATSTIKSCSWLEEVTIGRGFTTLNRICRDCAYLKRVNYNATRANDLASSVCAFMNCGNSDEGISVYIGSNVETIPSHLFYYFADSAASYSRLRKIVFPATSALTYIGDEAFRVHPSAPQYNEDVIIPNTVTEISSNAFAYIPFNGKLVLPPSVAKIESGAFNYSKFSELQLNCDNIITIQENAFGQMTELVSIYYNVRNSIDYSSANIFVNAGNTLKNVAVTIGKDAVRLPNYLFPKSAKITSLAFEAPSSVETIGDYAFYDAELLTTSVTLPDTVTSVGTYAFAESFITGINLGNGAMTVGANAFQNAPITTLTLGKNLLSLAAYVFGGCKELLTIYLNCERPVAVTGAQNVFTNAGYNSHNITLYVGDNVTAIPANMFYSTDTASSTPQITSIVWGTSGNLKTIGAYAFRYNQFLQTIDIPEGVTTVGEYAFQTNKNATSLTIPSTVQVIGTYAFGALNSLATLNYNCTALQNLVAGSNLFYRLGYNNKAVTINVGSTVTYFPTYLFACNDTADGNEYAIAMNLPHGFSAFRGYSMHSLRGSFKDIYYDGTVAEWNAITKETNWKYSNTFTAHCSDGDITVT